MFVFKTVKFPEIFFLKILDLDVKFSSFPGRFYLFCQVWFVWSTGQNPPEPERLLKSWTPDPPSSRSSGAAGTRSEGVGGTGTRHERSPSIEPLLFRGWTDPESAQQPSGMLGELVPLWGLTHFLELWSGQQKFFLNRTQRSVWRLRVSMSSLFLV